LDVPDLEPLVRMCIPEQVLFGVNVVVVNVTSQVVAAVGTKHDVLTGVAREHLHVPRNAAVGRRVVHGAELRAAFVTQILAVHVAKTHPIRKSWVRFYVPPGRLPKPVVRIVVTVGFMDAATEEFSMMIVKLNGNTEASTGNRDT